MVPPHLMPVPIQAPEPPPPAQDRSTVVRRCGVDCCAICDLAIQYCRCGTVAPEAPPALDGSASTLRERIIEVKQ
jgi:hypothetical protein